MATVKTAISVPRHLFEQIDHLAKRLRVPRSRLFSRALQEFVERRQADEVTAQLNRAYAADDSDEEKDLRRAATGAFRRLLERSR